MTAKRIFNILFLDLNKKKNKIKNYVMGWAGRDSIRSYLNFIHKGRSPFSKCESCYCKIRSLSMCSISCCTRSHVFTSFVRLKKSKTAEKKDLVVVLPFLRKLPLHLRTRLKIVSVKTFSMYSQLFPVQR